MSSTILYKFRSGTTFEALPLPGSAARLFDVKKAIVQAKKLDQGSIEFDLSVRDASTNVEYTDESMLLPRGTRVVVQRLPAARGHGFLARLARSQYAGGAPPPSSGVTSAAPDNFYTIESRGEEEDEEFVSSAEDKELAALRAATDAATATSSSAVVRSRAFGGRGGGPAGQGPPAQRGGPRGPPPPRPNADPGLREQEKQPKKRATGIPRTFLNLNAPPATSAEGEGDANVPLLQPNAIGFEELKHRGGGQSENALSSKQNLDYALKLTATTIPEYLQCAICNSVVRDAMILPWDPEGRTTCEACIRDALTQNGFRCPLTGQEGVSPDDLLPNHALRKAAEQFIKGVMEKMEEVEKQQVEDDNPATEESGEGKGVSTLDADGAEKGVLVSRRASLIDRKKQEDDPFGGGDDDFGGDVFAVEAEKNPEEEVKEKEVPKAETKALAETKEEPTKKEDPEEPTKKESGDTNGHGASDDHRSRDRHRSVSPKRDRSPSESRSGRRDNYRRGPPMGYTMGPAGGAASGPFERDDGRVGRGRSPRNTARDDGSYDGGYHGGAPRGGRGGRWNDRGGRHPDRYDGRGESRSPREEVSRSGSLLVLACVGPCLRPWIEQALDEVEKPFLDAAHSVKRLWLATLSIIALD